MAILPETGPDGAQAAAEKIRKAVESLDFPVEGRKVKITISAGVSTYPLNSSNKESLIEAADEALYHAKEGGRNQVRVSDRDASKIEEEKKSEPVDTMLEARQEAGLG